MFGKKTPFLRTKRNKYILLNNLESKHRLLMKFGQFILQENIKKRVWI